MKESERQSDLPQASSASGKQTGAASAPLHVIGFYHFVSLSDLPALRAQILDRCRKLGVRGTVLLSPEGINCSISGTELAVFEFKAFMQELIGARSIRHSLNPTAAHPFKRLRVKLKREIIPMGIPGIDPSRLTGKRLMPEELARWLDEKRDFVLLDTRNEFEFDRGTFESARSLGLKNFRQFPELLQKLDPADRDKPIVMFCTGGVRCEKATAYALQEGIGAPGEIYQLEGGILHYFDKCGTRHYQGGCFVFDEREIVD